MANENKRLLFTLEQKLQVLKERKSGRTFAAIARDYNCSKAAIHGICSNEEQWQKQLDDGADPSRKRADTVKYNEIDSFVWKWHNEARLQSVTIDSNVLRQKAFEFAQERGLTGFKASNGWLTSFRKRHGIMDNKSAEKIPLSREVQHDYFEPHPDYESLSVCSICRKSVSTKLSRSAPLKHLQHRHPEEYAQCRETRRTRAESPPATKQKPGIVTDSPRGGVTFEVNPLVAKRAGSSFVIKSRLLNRISFTHLEETADAIDFRNECTIFVLPCITEDEGPKLHCLRCLLQSEAVCLEREQQRVWRLTVDSSTVLTKLVQLGFGVASSCVDADGVHTWTLVGLDDDGSGDALPALDGADVLKSSRVSANTDRDYTPSKQVKKPSKKLAAKLHGANDITDLKSTGGRRRSTKLLKKRDAESDEHADEVSQMSNAVVAEPPEKRRLSECSTTFSVPVVNGKKLRSRVYHPEQPPDPVSVNHPVNIGETTRSAVLKASSKEENDGSPHVDTVQTEKRKLNAAGELDEFMPDIGMDGDDLSRLLSTADGSSVNDSHCSTLNSGERRELG